LTNYAFHFRYKTGRSSPFIQQLWGAEPGEVKDVEDDFDSLESWYLYFVKPLLGATLGLLFALVVELGLVSLGGDVAEGKRAIRLVALGGMAGLFAENVLHRMRAAVT
jgi:hypothetical protein